MDPKPVQYLAPPPSGTVSAAVRFLGAHHPSLDDHLVEPETRAEMVRGQRVIAMPARPPHADRHCELDYVIRAHVAPGYIPSSDMLTRAGPGSEFATDTSVRKQGIDPETGTRYLEELAFEVVSRQSLRDITIRAEELTNRGVRRLLAIFVKRGEVREWSPSQNGWVPLSLDGVLDDPTLARPVAIRALLDAAAADDAVIDALDAKGNRRLQEIKSCEREEGREEGRQEGRIQAIEAICRVLDISISPERRAQLLELDASGLERLLAKIESERRWP
jgi:hypothetical protein